MRPVRNVWSELVERRLWPVALLLVAALVAVPVLLAKSPPPTTEEAAPAAVAAAASAAALPGGEAVVSVAQGDEPDAPLRGHAKNPFRQQHVQADSSATASSATVTAGAPNSGSGNSGASSGGTGDSGSGGGAQPAPQPQPQPTFAYATVDARFGHAGQRLRVIRDIPRLTPLPNANHPIVVFLGTRRDRETAVFLVSTDVHVQGLGQCVPSHKDCEAIELHEGETALLDFTEADGRVEQYELDLDDVSIHTTTSKAVAQRAYARTSRLGKLLVGGSVRSSADGTARSQRLPFRYVRRSGVLHIARWASRHARAARAHGAISDGRLADLTPAGG
ncbi:MAG: hypothetical protein ACJ76L_09960 [Conexibacter sp.]